MTRKLGGFLLLILILFATSGCTRYINHSVQDQQTGYIDLDNQTNLGQTFTARFAGLAGVGLVLKPTEITPSVGAGEIILHLRIDPQSNQDLRTVSIPLQKVNGAGSYRFYFQPLPDSNQQDYYLLLEMKGDENIGIGIAGSETYLDGAAYKNGISDNGQLTFSLKYDSASLYSGLIKEILLWLVWLLVSLFIFVLPGWALLSLAWSNWQMLDFWEKFSLGAGASLAIYPILFLCTSLVGLHLGVLYAWMPPIIGLVVIAWRNYKAIYQSVFLRSKNHLQPDKANRDSLDLEKPVTQENPDPAIAEAVQTASLPAHLSLTEQIEKLTARTALIILVGVIIFSRLWAIRSLDFPLWGDSYQHTMIAQLLVDNHGLFQSWLPYAELSTFTYHFGFHTLVACFDWISGLPMEKAMLWVGQIVSILAVICLYPLAKKLGKNHWSGVFMLLIAGLISPMPMSYLNWGRYTQLAGQAILPTAVFCFWQLLQSDRLDRRNLVVYWIILGGLALTHYRVLIFILFFVAAMIIMNWRTQPRAQLFQKIFWISIGGAILFLPWFITIAPYSTIHNFVDQLTTLPGQASSFLMEYNALGNPLEYFPPLIWFSLPIIIGWAFWRREKEFTVIMLWWYLIFLAANPQIFGLPGVGVLNNFSIQIGFYIPFGIIIGAVLARAIGGLGTQVSRAEGFSPALKNVLLTIETLAVLVGVVALSISLIRQRLDDIKPIQYALMTRPDERAMHWIQQNTNPDDRFLVNSFFAYGGSLVAGSDGGWWLPLLTKRISTQPPLNYGSEEGFVPGYTEQVNQLIETIKQKGVSDPEVLYILLAHRIDYIYIGQQQGRVNSPKPLMNIDILQNNPRFQLVYHQDQVWIYKITSHNP